MSWRCIMRKITFFLLSFGIYYVCVCVCNMYTSVGVELSLWKQYQMFNELIMEWKWWKITFLVSWMPMPKYIQTYKNLISWISDWTYHRCFMAGILWCEVRKHKISFQLTYTRSIHNNVPVYFFSFFAMEVSITFWTSFRTKPYVSKSGKFY